MYFLLFCLFHPLLIFHVKGHSFPINIFFCLSFVRCWKKMEKNLAQVDLLLLQETEIFEDELIFFFPTSLSGRALVLKKICMSLFLMRKSKPCFSNIIMSFINSIISQIKIVFFAFFFLKKVAFFWYCVFFQSCFVPGNFNVHAMNSVNTFLTESTSLLEQNICLKNEPSEFVTARKKNLN